MPQNKWPKNEVQLAQRFIDLIEEEGWDVYQEVSSAGGLIDIVAIKTISGIELLWAVETKTSLGLPLIAQARKRQVCADLVSVAVPERAWRAKKWTEKQLIIDILRHLHLGLVLVWPDEGEFSRTMKVELEPEISPRFNRKYRKSLREWLSPEHKTSASAGTKDGGYWSVFRKTVKALQDYVATQTGPVELKHALKQIVHHYANPYSALNAISKMIDKGVIAMTKTVVANRLYVENKVEVKEKTTA